MTSITKFTEALRFILRTEYYSEWEQQNTEKIVLQALKKSKTIMTPMTVEHCSVCLGKGNVIMTFGRMFAQWVCRKGHTWYTRIQIVDGYRQCKVVPVSEVDGWRVRNISEQKGE